MATIGYTMRKIMCMIEKINAIPKDQKYLLMASSRCLMVICTIFDIPPGSLYIGVTGQVKFIENFNKQSLSSLDPIPLL